MFGQNFGFVGQNLKFGYMFDLSLFYVNICSRCCAYLHGPCLSMSLYGNLCIRCVSMHFCGLLCVYVDAVAMDQNCG